MGNRRQHGESRKTRKTARSKASEMFMEFFDVRGAILMSLNRLTNLKPTTYHNFNSE